VARKVANLIKEIEEKEKEREELRLNESLMPIKSVQ
jgi:hypothetical protein